MQELLRHVSALAAFLVLVACDPQRISELEEGVATEADGRAPDPEAPDPRGR